MWVNNGSSFLSGVVTNNNFSGIHRLIEHLRFDTLYARSASLWLRIQLANLQNLADLPLSAYLKQSSTRDTWLKLLLIDLLLYKKQCNEGTESFPVPFPS